MKRTGGRAANVTRVVWLVCGVWQRLFASLDEIPAYLTQVPLQCSAIMMMHPPGQQVGTRPHVF